MRPSRSIAREISYDSSARSRLDLEVVAGSPR